MKKKIKKSAVAKTLPFLEYLSAISDPSRKKILNELNGNKDIFKSMKEISVNTLKGNIALPKSKQKLLKRHIKTMKAFSKASSKRCSCKKRKYLIQQGSGFLPLLIPAVASIISSIIAKKNE